MNTQDVAKNLFKFLGIGLAANVALAIPYYFLIEVPAAADNDPTGEKKDRELSLLGTEAQCLVPWLFVATHLPIVVSGAMRAVREGDGVRNSILTVDRAVASTMTVGGDARRQRLGANVP